MTRGKALGPLPSAVGKKIESLRPGLVLALALALFAAGPFLARPSLPHQTDAELHIYRAAELGRALRAGAFYPRWAPNLYLGYGYPIFNFYAPLTYYLANLFSIVPGAGIVVGVKAVFVAGLILASVGTYLLGRELSNGAGGVLAAASFVLSPYVVFIDPHARGDLAEHFAICLLPLAFYCFHRLMSGAGGKASLLGSVLTLAALVFSHNLLGLVSSGLLFAYWAWRVILGTERAGWGLLAFALAAAIIAFFWLPFLLERPAIKLEVIGPGHFDFRNHFLSLRELLAPSRLLDWGATAPRYRHNLGLAQWLLALPVLVVFANPRLRGSNRTLAYFALSALCQIFLMVPASRVVWEHIPGLSYLQFPWRLLGPANLMLAACSVSSVLLLPDKWWSAPVLGGALAAVLVLAIPVLYPLPWEPDFGGTSPYNIIQWEQRSLAYGTTSTGDFLPVKAALVPMHPEETLVRSYKKPGPVDKVNRVTIPDGADVEVVEHGPLHDRFAISASEKFKLRLYTFYFPGWHAYVDGEEVDIEVAGPEGFITLWVPADTHEVLVRFEDTPPRTAGWIISGVGLITLIVAVVLMPCAEAQDSAPSQQANDLDSAPRKMPTAVWLGGVLALVIALKGVVIDPQNWLRYHSPPGQAEEAQHELRANFGRKIELLGYTMPQRRVRPGGKLTVVLYWRTLTPLEKNYQAFVHLAQPLNVAWAQEDHLNPGGLPTTRWPLDKYVWDEYTISIPSDAQPGEYVVNVGLYLQFEGKGKRLKRCDEREQLAGDDSAVIATVEVVE